MPGLTRQALDTCIDTFFSTIGHVIRLSESQDVFCRRARVRLYYSAGLDVPAELADVAHAPATELLVLAVACRGAPFSPHPYLAEPIYRRCCELVNIPENMMRNGCDAIEALLLLSELSVRTRQAKIGSGSKLSPNHLDPLGKGTVIDLVFYHGLHVPPPQHAPDFNRRLLLHATAWVHDAIRSASAHRMCRIADEATGWPLPVNGDDFVYVPLTLVTRQICSTLLSSRAKGLGIRTKDVNDALAEIGGLQRRTGISVEQLASLVNPSPGQSSSTPRDGARPISLTEYVWLLSTQFWLYVVTWVAVQEDIDRHPGGLSLGTVADVKSATTAACEEMARLAELCTTHRLHVYAPRGVRNHFAAFTLFLLRDFATIAAPSVAQSCQYYALAETLTRGVRSACYYPDSARLADTLLMMLHHGLRVEIRDAALVAERGLEALATVSAAQTQRLEAGKSHPAILNAPHETKPSTSPVFQVKETPPDDSNPQTGSFTTQPDNNMFNVPSSTSAASYSSSPWRPPTPGSAAANPAPLPMQGEARPFSAAPRMPDHLQPPHPPQSSSQTGNTPSMSAPQNPSFLLPNQSTVDLDWFSLMNTLMECGVEIPMGTIPDLP